MPGLPIAIALVAVGTLAAFALSTGPLHGALFDAPTSRAVPGPANQRAGRLAPYDLRITRRGHSLLLSYYRNDVAASAAREAVIWIHGTARDAEAYYRYALGSPSYDPSSTLLLCPLFLEAQDLLQHPAISPSYLYWATTNEDLPRDQMVMLTDANSYLPSLDSWSLGQASAVTPSRRPFTISSYACIDRLVAWVVAHYPHVRSIRIAAHSAGGVFVTRYALGTRITSAFPSVDFRFAPMNATSHCYLSGKRDPHDTGTFTVPNDPPVCYDYFRYSVDRKLSGCPYLDAVGAAAIRRQYRDRRVMVCVGSADTRPTNDDSASALLQGAHRCERGVIFHQHVLGFYGGAAPGHTLRVVPGVGHDAHAMIDDPSISRYVFGP